MATIAWPKRHYVLAILCYLSIPAVVIVGGIAFSLIDPEMARGRADYTRVYHLIDLARRGAVLVAGGLVLVLWIACCYLVLRSRSRSLLWLALAAVGALGFGVIAALEDRSPAPGDRYQRFIGGLRMRWRVPLELAVFVSVWVVAYQAMVLQRNLMIELESRITGTPVSTIVERQAASSGMYAAGEGMEVLYLVPLIYLFWPIAFNVVGHLLRARSPVPQGNPTIR